MIGAKIAIAGGGVLLAASTAGRGLDAPDGPRDIGNGSTIDGWTFPLPTWCGYRAVISDGPGANKRDGGARSHNGVDIDYKAKSKDDLTQFKVRTAERSSSGMFFCPTGIIPVLAVRDGFLWSCSLSTRGWQISLDHGKPFATYYQHMQRVFLPRSQSGSAGKVAVRAGQVIGIVGNGSPPAGSQAVNAFNHLHFEVWKDGGAAQWIDPTPILARANHLDFARIKVPA